MSERPTQYEIDEQEVLKLAEECGAITNDTRKGQIIYYYSFPTQALFIFSAKLREKDAATIAEQKEEIASLKAQLAEAQKVPEGWQLVPTKPTLQMVIAVASVKGSYLNNTDWYAEIHQAMLSAAPTYKKE